MPPGCASCCIRIACKAERHVMKTKRYAHLPVYSYGFILPGEETFPLPLHSVSLWSTYSRVVIEPERSRVPRCARFKPLPLLLVTLLGDLPRCRCPGRVVDGKGPSLAAPIALPLNRGALHYVAPTLMTKRSLNSNANEWRLIALAALGPPASRRLFRGHMSTPLILRWPPRQ